MVYIAHWVSKDPVAACRAAIDWTRWLTEVDETRVYVAPWLGQVLSYIGREVTEDAYDRFLADDALVVQRCDGLLVCGGELSAGVVVERAANAAADGVYFDLLEYSSVSAAAEAMTASGKTGPEWITGRVR